MMQNPSPFFLLGLVFFLVTAVVVFALTPDSKEVPSLSLQNNLEPFEKANPDSDILAFAAAHPEISDLIPCLDEKKKNTLGFLLFLKSLGDLEDYFIVNFIRGPRSFRKDSLRLPKRVSLPPAHML